MFSAGCVFKNAEKEDDPTISNPAATNHVRNPHRLFVLSVQLVGCVHLSLMAASNAGLLKESYRKNSRWVLKNRGGIIYGGHYLSNEFLRVH